MADAEEIARGRYTVEHAKSARSSCSWCRTGIAANDLRLGALLYVPSAPARGPALGAGD